MAVASLPSPLLPGSHRSGTLHCYLSLTRPASQAECPLHRSLSPAWCLSPPLLTRHSLYGLSRSLSLSLGSAPPVVSTPMRSLGSVASVTSLSLSLPVTAITDTATGAGSHGSITSWVYAL
jgi:hypothetical protein